MPPPDRRRRRREDPRLASLPEEDKQRIKAAREHRQKLELPLTQVVQLRTANLLELHDYDTVERVLKAKKADLTAIENFGDKTMVELYWAIKDLGLETPPDWGKIPRPK